MVSSWKIAIAALVIFGAGLLTGAIATRIAARGTVTSSVSKRGGPSHPPEDPTMHGGPGWVRPDGFERIEKELKLSSTQQEIIHGYLKEGRARMKELMSTVGPKMKEESLRTRELIKKELTPDQIVKLDEIMKRKEKDREKDKDRPRDRPPFPRLDSHDPSEKSPRSSPKPGEGQF